MEKYVAFTSAACVFFLACQNGASTLEKHWSSSTAIASHASPVLTLRLFCRSVVSSVEAASTCHVWRSRERVVKVNVMNLHGFTSS